MMLLSGTVKSNIQVDTKKRRNSKPNVDGATHKTGLFPFGLKLRRFFVI